MRNKMKARRFPMAAILAAVIVLVGWAMTPRMAVQPDSRIWVEGTSTIHDWTMKVGTFTGSVTATTDNVEAVEISVPVKELNADNGTMNNKAYAALKANKHPNITYRLTTADVKDASDGGFEIASKGVLTIAGVTKPVTFTVKGEKLADGKFRYTGSTPIQMSDFGVDAPTAMLGTMKTGDKVVVHFNVVVD